MDRHLKPEKVFLVCVEILALGLSFDSYQVRLCALAYLALDYSQRFSVADGDIVLLANWMTQYGTEKVDTSCYAHRQEHSALRKAFQLCSEVLHARCCRAHR